MSNTQEEGNLLIQQMMLAALENQKGISAIIDDTDVFYRYVFSTRLTG